MGTDHKECVKSFSWHSKTWYGKSQPPVSRNKTIDEINIGFYHPEGGTTGEFTIQWEELSGDIVPRLKAFDDSWSALVSMPDLLSYMASIDGQNISIDKFVLKLKELGFENRTQTEPN